MSEPNPSAQPDPSAPHGASTQPGASAQQPASGQRDPYAASGGQPYQSYQPATAYPSGGYASPPRPTNTMAVVSLIAAITGITIIPVVGSIVGVITGHIARRQIAETGEEGSGFATAGLVVGYVGIALLVVVIVLIVAALVGGLALFASVPTSP